LDFLKKIGNKPNFKHVAREASAVRQELLTLLEDTEYHMELAQINALFPNSAYARGSNAELEMSALPKFDSKMLKKYYENNYVNKMFIVISGGPSVKGAKTMMSVPYNMVSSIPKMVCAPFPQNKNVVHVQRSEVEKSKCILTFYNDAPTGESIETLKDTIIMATHILSGGLDSLLYRELRDKLQLVYRVSCTANIEPYGIIIEISWSCDTNKVKMSTEAIFNVLKKFTPLHFDGHKNLYLEQLVKNNTLSSEDIVDVYGESLVTWGRYTRIEHIIAGVKKIEPNDVVNAVKTFMRKERCFLVHASSKARPPITRI